MSAATRANMLYSDYRWTARPEDNPNYRRGADYHLLNRSEGYEMLYAINTFLARHPANNNVATAHHIERLIRTRLPHGSYTHNELYTWLVNNWNS